MCRSKHVKQLRNAGIINSTTRSHLVGYFCNIYKSRSVSLEHGNCNGVGGSSLSLVWVAVCISLPDVNGGKVFPGTESVS